jgi:hypothetical protein
VSRTQIPYPGCIHDPDQYPGLPGAAPATTVDTLDYPSLLQLGFRYAADTVGREVRVSSLDTAETAEVLIPLLLPLSDQVLVSYLLLDTVVVEFSGDGLPPVEEVEDVSGFLMMDLEYRPQRLCLPLPFVPVSLGFPHFCLQLLQGRFDKLPALWRRLSASADLWHSVYKVALSCRSESSN